MPCTVDDKQSFQLRDQVVNQNVPVLSSHSRPRLCVAPLNSHLRQPDEAKAATSWLRRPSVAQRKRERFCFS